MRNTILAVFMLIFSFSVLALSPEDVKLDSFVNDYAGILSPEEKSQITSVAQQIYDSGKAEYAVAVVDNLEGYDIESYSYKVVEGKLGETGKNNGLFLIVAIEDRAYRIEVGRGLEPDIPDITAGRIAREFLVPNFQEERYAEGIYQTSLALRSVLLNDTASEYYPRKIPDISINQEIIGLIIFFVFMILIISRSSRLNKRGKRRNRNDLFSALLLASMLRGGGRGGFSGGGFGGFGGGSFGGGGAGGRW